MTIDVTVTAVPAEQVLVKAPNHPDQFVMIRDVTNDGEWLPIGEISRVHDGWQVPSGLVYGQKLGAALDQARRFIAHDNRSPFTLATTNLTYKDDA